MTTTHIRQCPRCELRFTSSSELDYHLANDHRPRRDPDPVVALAPAALPPPPPDYAPPLVVRPTPRSRATTWVLVLAGLVLIALVAWLAPTSTVLITAAWVVVLVLCYRWRTRVRSRTRHR